MIDLGIELRRWYYKHPERPSIIYIGKRQQIEMENECNFWMPEGACSNVTEFHGYKVIYVDQDDYLRLGD